MITLCTALSWLNVLGPQKTQLRVDVIPFVAQFFDAGQPDQLDVLVANVRYIVTAPMEKAEVLLNAAAANCGISRYDEATVQIKQALDIYGKHKMAVIEKDHHQAIANWALGIIAQWLRNPTSTYERWNAALVAFNKNSSNPNLNQIYPGLSNWYSNPSKEMEMDLIGNVHYIFGWFNLTRPSGLNQNALAWQERMSKLICARDYVQALELLKKYRAFANDFSQSKEKKDEMYTYCGMASYLMTNYDLALNNYQIGTSSLPSRQHQDAIILWLKGIAHWEYSQQDMAIASWEKSISYFEEEKETANRKNNRKDYNWYSRIIPLVEEVLSRRVKEFTNPSSKPNPFSKPPRIIIPTIAP